MRLPKSLVPLMDHGVIEEVIRPLMAGKEAQLYLVTAHGETRVAKVYKQATERSFKHRTAYTEGRRVRNSRQQRALGKRSRYGREQAEDVWRNAEVDAMSKLGAAGVRVPEIIDFMDGVLIMELIADEAGQAAPRLVDIEFTEAEAEALHKHLLTEVVRMLCAGVVHGDLSDFNVLMGADGPVIIDFPQVVDPAHNRNARELLIRDVDNVTSFLARFAPRIRDRNYGLEMWEHYEANTLSTDTVLLGKSRRRKKKADTSSILDEIAAAERSAERRGLTEPKLRPTELLTFEEAQEQEQNRPRTRSTRKKVVIIEQPKPPPAKRGRAKQRPPKPKEQSLANELDALLIVEEPTTAAKPKRRRRRRRRGPAQKSA